MSDEVKNIGIGYSVGNFSQDRKKIGIGLFGRGFMGKAHSNAYKTISYMYESNYVPELIAISATTVENAKAAADRYGYKRCYAGWEDLIADAEVSVFDNVCVDSLHMQPCIDAAKAGKHIICEKPMTLGRESAKKMLDAVRKANVKHAVCFNYRFQGAVRLAYDLIKKGAIGDILHFYGRYHQEYALPLNTPVENVWYQNMTGNSQGLGTHIIDQARFLVGDIVSIAGDMRSVPKQRPSTRKNGALVDVPYDDSIRALVEFSNGATGTIENMSIASGRYNHLYWEIYGTKGTITWSLEDPTYLNVQLREAPVPEIVGFTRISCTLANHPFMNVWWPAGHNCGWEHGHINLIAHFLDCVANDKEVGPLCATFEDGYKASVILETLAESSEAGKKLDVVY
jgi:predicted dehydrogenase